MTSELWIPFFTSLDPFFLIYFGAINLIYTILLFLGSIRTFFRRKELSVDDYANVLRSASLPQITFFIPAYNESANVMGSVRSVLHLTYRKKQIIVINDGSTDDTFEILKKDLDLELMPLFFREVIPTKPIRGLYESRLYPDVLVIDKENGTKFDALNAALNFCKNPYFITVDADTFIDDAGFEALIRPMFAFSDAVGFGASVRIKNGCELAYNKVVTEGFPPNFVTAMQSIEYMRAFLMRQGWDLTGGNFVLSGAFSVLSREAVMKVGGFAPTFGNDLEIIVRLHRVLKATHTPYKIMYVEDPVAWTDAPNTWKELAHQRMLWHRGLLEALWFHKSLFFNPRYGAFGLFVFPFMVIFEAIEPLVEIFGYIYIILGLMLGAAHATFIILFLLLSWGFCILFTQSCLVVEEFSFRRYPSLRSIGKLFFYTFLENFGYRQATLLWRFNGWVSFFKRFKEVRADSKKLNQSIKIIEKET